MMSMIKKPTALCLVVTLLLLSLGSVAIAQDKEPSAGAMIADTVLARPIGLVSMVLGPGAFIISLPFSALGGNIGVSFQKMVVDPVKFTFARPLGEF